MSRTVVFPRGPSPLPRPAPLHIRYAYRAPPGPTSRVFLLLPAREASPRVTPLPARDEATDLNRLPFLRCELEGGAAPPAGGAGGALLALADEAFLPLLLRGAAEPAPGGRRRMRHALLEVTEDEARDVARRSNSPFLVLHAVDPEGGLRAAYYTSH